MTTKLEQVARAIGEIYDGYADPVETPENWKRATAAALAAIDAMKGPTPKMATVGVDFALSSGVSGAYAWRAYVSDLFDAMLSASIPSRSRI